MHGRDLATVRQHSFHQAAQPRLVKRDLLQPWIVVASTGKRSVPMGFPEALQPGLLLSQTRLTQSRLRSLATTASATCFVPTALGSSRVALRS